MARINGALAVFVKTPELSPVKTRLAADIGKPAAAEVYDALLAAAADLMRQMRRRGMPVYWAVGEREGVANARWREFPALFAGDGGLGARLHRVYSLLRNRHGGAALAGADCPELTAGAAENALRHARQRAENVVVGQAADGGFYLFAASRRIPRRVWTSVAYSRGDTLARLVRHFSPRDIAYLPMLSDVDDADSLRAAGFYAPKNSFLQAKK